MASTDAKAIPVKNAAYRVTFPILDADGDLVSGATGLDSEVSIDGGTFADCTNEATEIATSSGMYFLDLTSTEMNGDTIAVIVKTSSVGAKTTPIVLYTAARSINDLAYPTTSGRAIDVSAGGEVGLDWANIGSPTTAVNLSATNIDVDQVVASVSGAVGSVTGAVGSVTGNVGGNVAGTVASVVGNVGGNVTGSVGSVVGAVGSVTGNVGGNVTGSVGSVAAGGITAASIADNAIDAGAIAADAITAAKIADNALTAAKFASGAFDAVWSVASRTLTGFGTLVADIWASASRTLTAFAFSVTVGTNNDKTGYTTTTADKQGAADQFLNRDLAGGGSGGARIVRDALRILRNRRAVAGGTLTVYAEDDSTPAWTATVSTAAGNPVDSIAPS